MSRPQGLARGQEPSGFRAQDRGDHDCDMTGCHDKWFFGSTHSLEAHVCNVHDHKRKVKQQLKQTPSAAVAPNRELTAAEQQRVAEAASIATKKAI